MCDLSAARFDLVPFFQEGKQAGRPARRSWFLFLLGLALLSLPARQLRAQSLFATLTGIVSDPSGAVVPGATVKLINEQSGSTRDTVTNAEGYYTFVSVSVGNFSYKLRVE